jgi:sRNA-binding carbon storage regulator CsrA
VTSCLKVGIVEPEETSIARQQLSERVPAAKDAHATVEVLLDYNNGNDVFYTVLAEVL